MAKIFNNMTELIGKTPLVKINKLIKKDTVNIFAKIESFNPMSSIKDRIALSMIETAEKEGLINQNSLIIEPTSGNTGIGLAFVCAVKGYKLILTMPETMSIERRSLLKGLGADIILTKGKKGMKGAIEEANIIKEKHANAFMPQQFKNQANPQIHRKTTAIEILNDTDNKIDIFVAGIGTGGTITGVGEILKQKIPCLEVIGVEPFDSAVLNGEKPGPHKIQGIGAGFIPDVLNIDIIDRIIKVKNDEALKTADLLMKKEGILCGISSGAALCAALKIAENLENKNIVVILPDTGERYISTELFKK